MIKRILAAILVISTLFVFSGCTLLNEDISELFRPPQLDAEQQAVIEAVKSVSGGEYTLKHPRAGTNRSSVVFTDMDGDNKDEAVAFFMIKGMTTIRVQFFDSVDGKWVPTTSVDGDCSEVYQYEFIDIDGDKNSELVIGWDISLTDTLVSNTNISTKRLSVYDFSDGSYNQIYTAPYSYMLKVNLDSDSCDEIAVIATEPVDPTLPESPLVNKFYLIRSVNSVISNDASVELFSGVTAYSNLCEGKIGDGTPAVFLDAKLNTGEYITQVLQFNGSTLSKLFPDIEKNPTRRTSPVFCMDIDGDTITEFPVCSPLPDYTPASPAMRYLTDWCTYEKGVFTTTLSSIISLTYDFYITLNGDNRGRLTAEIDPDESLYTIRFSNGSLTGTPLFYIKRFAETDGANVASEGYTILFTTQGYIVAAKLSDNNYSGKFITIPEVLNIVHPISFS